MPRKLSSFAHHFEALQAQLGPDFQVSAQEYINLHRKWTRERIQAGIAYARANGTRHGRPPCSGVDDPPDHLLQIVHESDLSNRKLGKLLGVHFSRIHRWRVKAEARWGVSPVLIERMERQRAQVARFGMTTAEAGRLGGQTRARNLSAAQRRAQARKAVQTRWRKAKST